MLQIFITFVGILLNDDVCLIIPVKASCRPDAERQWSEIMIGNVPPALIAYAHSAVLIIGYNICNVNITQ